MKSKLLTAFFSLMLIAGSAGVSSFETFETKTMPNKTNNCFSSFRAHRQGAGVTLNWGISNAADIDRFEVQRSYDGEFFDCIANAECLGSTKFKFADNDVYPGLTYYRVAAIHTDGTAEFSAVEAIRIVSRK